MADQIANLRTRSALPKGRKPMKKKTEAKPKAAPASTKTAEKPAPKKADAAKKASGKKEPAEAKPAAKD